MLSWQPDARTVSIWTVHGRLKGVAYTGSPEQLKAVATLPVGESDLVHRDGMWFLYASVEVPEPELIDPDGFLGVDMGIANIAYDSDGPLRRTRSSTATASATAAAHPAAGQGHQVRPSAPGQTQSQGSAARREHQPPHRQEHRGRGCTHRAWDRRRTLTGIRRGYGSASPNGSRCTHGRSPNSATS